MKKIIAIVICAALVISMFGCSGGSKSTSVETYNGITRTEVTTTNGDKVETVVTYTDADGKTMDEAEGEAAFNAAKDAVEGSIAEMEESIEATEEDIEGTTEAVAEEDPTVGDEVTKSDSSAQTYYVPFTLVNESENDITQVYFLYDAADDWGTNLLGEGEKLAANKGSSITGHLTFTLDQLFKLGFVDADGHEASFRNITFNGYESNDIIITIYTQDGEYYLNVNNVQ